MWKTSLSLRSGGCLLCLLTGVLLPASTGGLFGKESRRPAVPVRTEAVEKLPLEEKLTLNGVLRGDESAELRAEVAGIIVELPYREAGEVGKGDLLAKIDGTETAAELEEVEAEIELADSRLARLRRLSDSNAISDDVLDEASTRRKTLDARRKRLQSRYAKTEIRAPFDGRTGLRRISIGDYLEPGDLVAELQKIDPLKVDFGLPEVYQSRLKKGLKIRITSAGVAEVASGELVAWNNRVDESSRTIQLRGIIPNEDHTFFPGNFVTVELLLGDPEEAILIPTNALVRSLGKASVFVVEDGIAKERKVTVGVRQASRIQILEGLEEGETIVTYGTQGLSDGTRVREVNL